MSDRVLNFQLSSPEADGELKHRTEDERGTSVPAARCPDGDFHSWYYGNADCGLDFPQSFRLVLTANASDRNWKTGIDGF
jgi:hypothetical protein